MAENEEKTVVKTETKKNERLAEFDEFYASKLKPRLLDRYKDEVECIRKTIERFDRMLDYNVPHGKKNRGLCVYESYLGLLDKNSTNCPDDLASRESRIEQAKALGWCIEFLQASFLVADDIMDNSTFRRGNPCWYLYENTGNIAINDSFFLLGSVYDIINEYLPKHPMYPRFYELFSHTITSTVVGQGLDLITPPKFNNDSLCDFTNYTQQQYDSIVKWKTAFYSFCLPVRAALYLACIDDREVHDKCNRILFDMGHFFQIQDDYLDCFGDPQIMGKVGTDIEECKCSWLVVQALKKCSHQQRETLEKCYGRQDHSKVASVKKIYQDLNLQGDYEKFENEAFERISKDISNLTFDTSKLDADKTKLIRDILNGYFKKIFKRNK